MRTILFCLLVFLFFPDSTYADTAVSVQPSVVYIDQASSSATITLINSADSEVIIEYTSLYLEPQPDGLLLPKVKTKEKPEIIIANSTQEPPMITLPAQSSRSVNFSVKKTQTAYIPGLMFFSRPAEVPADKTSTQLSGAIVVPIVFKGNTHVYSISLTQYKTTSVALSDTAAFAPSVKNNTSEIVEVSGSLTIRNLLGNEVKHYNIPHTIVFGNQTRALETMYWEPKLLIGLYTTELELQFGDSKTSHKRFLIGLPIPFAVFLLFAGLIISGICLRVVKYNK